MPYPRLIVDAQQHGYKIQAWPHGLHQHGPHRGQFSWCVELTRPGDHRPAMTAGRNRPGWPEFHHKDDAFEAAEQVLAWANDHGMVSLLPVPLGLRLVHRLSDYMESQL